MERVLAGLALISALSVSTALAQNNPDSGRNENWRPMNRAERLFNPQTIETINGKVVREETGPGHGLGRGVHLLVRTDSGTIPVLVGPSWFIDNQEPQIERNDQIEVIGSKVTINGRTALIASEIRKDGQVMQLRDEEGRPVWAAWRSGGGRRGQGMMDQGMGGGMMGRGMMMGQGMGMRGGIMGSEMKAQHEKILAKWHSMEADLNKKLEKMDEATGDAKVQAMGKVIDELVQQRNEMIDHVLKMHEQMVSHMERMHGMSSMGASGVTTESSSKKQSSEK